MGLYAAVIKAGWPEGPEEERCHACEKPDYGDQHGLNPTGFVLISKHEVINRHSTKLLIKKDHIGTKCKKKNILSSPRRSFASLDL